MKDSAPVTQTIILAAGSGSRLSSGARGIPKPLVTVAGDPLIAHALAHAQASGCHEAIVVLGHESARVRTVIEALRPTVRLRFVENPDPSTPNGVSLLAAAPFAAPRFFLQMVDHLFAGPVLPKLVRRRSPATKMVACSSIARRATSISTMRQR